MYRASFIMTLPSAAKGSLVYGKLTLIRKKGDAGKVYHATSGCIGCQYWGSWKLKGKGCLPPALDYSISTQRLWLPHVKGVEGSFYAIAPFNVRVGSVTRGDFGVHFDANVPGSAGCIVLDLQEHWDDWRNEIEICREKGQQSIPLAVTYIRG